MQVTFKIDNLKPIGFNNSYIITTRGKFPTRTKKKETREFEAAFHEQMEAKYTEKIARLNEVLAFGDYYMIIHYRFYFPILKRAGGIHKRAGDVDNLIKITQDCVFEHLLACDSEVIQVTATKIHSENYKIVADICVKELTHLQ